MTNIVQYLDIVAHNMMGLRDQGITPVQMVIEVSQDIMTQAKLRIQGNSSFVMAESVKTPFKGELINRGLVKFTRDNLIFHLTLKEENG